MGSIRSRIIGSEMYINGIGISKLVLGGAQFGQAYGISNNGKIPSYEDSKKLIKTAYDNGITCIDTAAAYGSSEKVIGRALKDLNLTEKLIVTTKIKPLTGNPEALKKAHDFIERSVINSLNSLRLDVLPVCIFHRAEDIVFYEILNELKEKAYIQYTGVSAIEPEQISGLMDKKETEVIQIPYSIIDKRCEKENIFSKAKKFNVSIFARSIYLQGVLLIPEDRINPEIALIIPCRRKLEALAAEFGISPAEMYLRYVLSRENIKGIAIGAERSEQIIENSKYAEKGALPQALIEKINDAVSLLEKKLLNPYYWKFNK